MSLWERLFGSSSGHAVAHAPLRVDIHSHLIPGIDDGSQSLEESIDLVRGLVDLGIQKIITTPHILRGSYNNTPESIRSGLEKLKPELRKAGLNVDIDCAAEYYFDDHFLTELVAEHLITFADKHVLL
jgi:protein-tyrosine phosphatase